jgi:hypothetical protein
MLARAYLSCSKSLKARVQARSISKCKVFLTSSSTSFTCLENGTFSGPNPIPSCVPVPRCGYPVPPFQDSGLTLVSNYSIPVGESAKYNCTDPTKITDQGPIVEIPCQLVIFQLRVFAIKE